MNWLGKLVGGAAGLVLGGPVGAALGALGTPAGKATETLMLKVYRDGLINLDLGSSSAQSVVLMVGIVVLTALQFRFIGRRNAE